MWRELLISIFVERLVKKSRNLEDKNFLPQTFFFIPIKEEISYISTKLVLKSDF